MVSGTEQEDFIENTDYITTTNQDVLKKKNLPFLNCLSNANSVVTYLIQNIDYQKTMLVGA